MENKKLVITILVLLMILVTINQALATNITINGTTSSNWKRLNDDLVVTNSDTYELSYYDSNGLDKTIDTTPYLASDLINYGIIPPSNTYASGLTTQDIVFLGTDKKIVFVDYGTNSITTRDQSGVLNFAYYDRYSVIGITGTYLVGLYPTDSSSNNRYFAVSLYSTNQLGGFSGTSTTIGCDYLKPTTFTRQCGKVFLEETSSGVYAISQPFQFFGYGNDIINFFSVLTIDESNQTFTNGTYSGATASVLNYNFRPNKYDATSYLNNGACYDDNNYVYCTGSGQEYTYSKSTAQKVATGTDATINDFYIDYSMKDDNGLNEIYIASNSSVYVYDGTNYDLLYAGQGNGIRQFSSAIILDDAVIYRLPSSNTWQFKTLDELSLVSETPPPPVTEENVTYITINSTNNFTGSDFRAMKLIENNQVLIGGSIFGTEGFIVIEYNDTENILVGDNGVETDTVYSIDTKPNSSPIKISVGTDEGIHSITYTYSYYIVEIKNETTNETIQNITHLDSLFDYRTRDRWGVLHSDDAYDVVTEDYDNYVCDSYDDTLDYNEEYNDPLTIASTQCYDIERHGNYLYVDAGSSGINVYDATGVTSVSYANNIPIRSSSNGLFYGDLLDIQNDLLVGITDEDIFTVYNITSDSSETLITNCNVAGAGIINSVEIISNELAMAGLQNGKVAVCDLTNTIEGTNVVVYEPITNNDIMAIEYDGENIHIIGGHDYIIATVESYTINTTTNTPPTLQSYSISDTTPELNQTVTITMVAGNVEPLDVIRYGIKCNSSVTNYTYSLTGQFECVYNTAGATTMTIAVTDNYHLSTWYNETNISITVLPTLFTGGLINVEVIDDETTEYVVGANVTADGTSVTTDSFGHATITTTSETSYITTTTATGYYDNYQTLLADGSYYVIRMNPLGSTNETNIIVTTTNKNTGTAIEGALVSYTNGVTYNYDYKFTDLNGRAIFTNTDSGLTAIQGSATDYEDSQTTISIIAGTTNEISLSMTPTNAYSGTLSLTRNCTDDGVWICGADSVVTTSCSVDADCPLTDYCTQGINKCSRFNYSRCDTEGLPRTQKCIASLTGNSILSNITNWMLSNLLWVIVLLILLIASGMIFVSWKGK